MHIQNATDVKKLLFLARLELLCKDSVCVPPYFQYKDIAFLSLPQKTLSLDFLFI